MSLTNYEPGERVRAADLFTMFTGLWGHEEFEARGHRLLKLKLGTVSADYKETPPKKKPLDAEKFGLAHTIDTSIRNKNEYTLVTQVIPFDLMRRPPLREIHKELQTRVNKKGKKILRGGQICWNIEHFTTKSASGHICRWVIENIGTIKEPARVPLLARINRVDAIEFDIESQTEVAGDMFEAKCGLRKKYTAKVECEGI